MIAHTSGRGGIATAVLASLVTVGAMAQAKSACAEDPSEPIVLAAATRPVEEIVVVATRREERTFDSPYTTQSISAATMADRLYRTIPEALRDVPGVMVQKTAHGHGSPFIRGFTGFRTLLLVDGIRLNNSTFRDGPNQYWNSLNPLSVAGLEIVKAPASVLYGSDAVGGAVNARMKGPDESGLGGRGYTRISTAERSWMAHAEVQAGQGSPWALYADGSVKDFGDLELGRDLGRQKNTGYDEFSASLKTRLRLSEDAALVLAHQTVEQHDVPRTHSTMFAKSFRGTAVGRDRRRDLDQKRHLTYAQIHAGELGVLADQTSLSLSWQRLSDEETRVRASGATRNQGFEVDTVGLWAQLDKATPLGTFTYGFDYYWDIVSSFSSANDIQGPVADDADYHLFGLYVQDDVDLTESLRLLLGARFTYARAKADSVRDPNDRSRTSIREDWNRAVGSARLRYEVLPERLSVFTGVSQAFRAPNLSDLTRFDSARSGEVETAATDLDAETFISYEVGFKARFGPARGEAAYYYTYADDMIVRVPTGREIGGETEITKVNAGDGWVSGVEVGAGVDLPLDLDLSGTFTWVDGAVDTFPTSAPTEVREPLDRLTPTGGSVRFGWHPQNIAFHAEAVGSFVAKQDQLSSRDMADRQRIPPDGTPGYSVFSLSAGWEVSEHLSVTVALENLADRDYRVHGSGTNEPGRNFLVAFDATF